ncbi:MAG: 3-oxoacyl-(acyl-carrier-protein) reductase [Alphaproteobacteria bacterium]|nr:3-oxoacyl-(acyl-carrier-protein) reductase [Alphaproteobacteria bacterium]
MSELDTHAPKNTSIPQHQESQPGVESEMNPSPRSLMENYKAAGKLTDKVALITGADSGIGRATAIGFAKEGADVAIVYLSDDEDQDAQLTKNLIEKEGRLCHLIKGDISSQEFCKRAVAETVDKLGRLNILVNNAAQQFPQESFEDITEEQLKRTFNVNIFSMFYLAQAAMKHFKEGDCIINTASVTAYKGNEQLIDYSSTKGAIVSFTRALSQQLAEKKIRVNAVAPGPIWTPLIPATFPAEKVAKFGRDTPLGRPGQPDEVATCYIFLASDDSSYITGQVLHPNGGTIVNG